MTISNNNNKGGFCHNLIRRTTCLVCFLVLLSLAVSGQPKTGQKAPEIALRDIKGVVQKLSGLSGKVVLVDFWASWCGPCRKSNPILVKLYNAYKQQGFEIYSISIDEDKAAWKKAIINDKMLWTHVNESGGWDGPVASAWKIGQVPTSYLLDKTGTVVAVDPGTLTLKNKIVEQLKKLP